MGNYLETYLKYVKNETIRRPIYKVDFLDKDTEVPVSSFSGDMIDTDGQITNTLNDGVRRSCSFTLKNFDQSYCDFFNTLGMGSKFKVYLGYLIDDKPIWFPKGVYIMDSPVLNSQLAEKTVSISGTDKWSMLNGTNGGVLQSTYTIAKGTLLGDVIPDILHLDIVSDLKAPAIYGGEFSKVIADNPDMLLKFAITYDITKDAGSYASDLILDICANANAYVYYNANGRLTVSPYEYDSTKPSVWDFVGEQSEYRSNDINYISAQKTYNYSDIYNAIMVVADNTQNDSVPITAEAINMDLSDPNSFPNLGYKKYKVITDYTQGISTQNQAQERANYELKKASARQSTISISCLPLYHLDVNNIIRITDPFINSDRERFLINSITTPMNTSGTMSLDVTKAKGYESFGGQ